MQSPSKWTHSSDCFGVGDEEAAGTGSLQRHQPTAQRAPVQGPQIESQFCALHQVITFAGELLGAAEALLRDGLHTSEVADGYGKAAAKVCLRRPWPGFCNPYDFLHMHNKCTRLW